MRQAVHHATADMAASPALTDYRFAERRRALLLAPFVPPTVQTTSMIQLRRTWDVYTHRHRAMTPPHRATAARIPQQISGHRHSNNNDDNDIDIVAESTTSGIRIPFQALLV